MTAVPPPPAQPKSSGCGKAIAIGCVVILILLAVGAVAVGAIAVAAIKHTDVYRHARDMATHDSRVEARLGAPVDAGWWVTGSVSTEDATGIARIKFPISGSRGKAIVKADATLENGSWKYEHLMVYPQGGGDIDVLHP